MLTTGPEVWLESESATKTGVIVNGRLVESDKSKPGSADIAMPEGLAPQAPDQVCNAHEVRTTFANCVANLRRWFVDPKQWGSYVGENLGPQYLTELAHLWAGLDTAIAICVAELEDKSLQELLIKSCFHFNRTSYYWNRIAAAVSGFAIDQLEPLPATYALQLALQELGKKDVLAFSSALDLFGTPGDAEATDIIRALVRSLISDQSVHALADEWASNTARNHVSYSSVDSIKAHGYPETGPYSGKVATAVSPLLMKNVQRSAALLQALDDNIRLFHMGIGIYYSERKHPFPRMRIDWLQEV
jgi:hypothetical protein